MTFVFVDGVHEGDFFVVVIAFAGGRVDLASALFAFPGRPFSATFFFWLRAIIIETAILASTIHLDKCVSYFGKLGHGHTAPQLVEIVLNDPERIATHDSMVTIAKELYSLLSK